MKTITTQDHIADLAYQLEADTLAEIFEAGLEAMNDSLIPGFCDNQQELPIKREIKVTAPDITALFIDFLSEVLVLSYREGVLFCKVTVEALDNTGITAKLNGTPIEVFDEDIKAVTYHQAEVRQNTAGKWGTLLILDV